MRGQPVEARTRDPEFRRRRRYRMVVGAAAVLMLVTAAVVWVWRRHSAPEVGSLRPFATEPSKAPRVAAVTYEVSGKGRVTIQYADPARTTTTTLTDQQLPWRVKLAPHAVSFVQITARRQLSRNGEFDADAHPVRALVDGVEVCSGTDEGGYLQSTCLELVPPL
jgi:hypothetical protein